MLKSGICRLCGQSLPLIKQSHIIPDFMYKGIGDEKNRIYILPLKGSKRKVKVVQTGYFEKHILCKDCDNNKIGSLERALSIMLFGGLGEKVPRIKALHVANGVDTILVENFDYNKVKLALLSILWRSHISTNPFFQKIDIDFCFEHIRGALLGNAAPEEDVFRISILAVKKSTDLVRLVIDPAVLKNDNGYYAFFFINGFFYFFDLVPSSKVGFFDKYCLRKKGQIEIPILTGNIAKQILSAIGLSETLVQSIFD